MAELSAQLSGEPEPPGASGRDLVMSMARRPEEALIARKAAVGAPGLASARALSTVLAIIRKPRSAAKLGARAVATWLGSGPGADHLARIDHERAVTVARAKAVVAIRRHLDVEQEKLGGDHGFGLFDVEERAWDFVLEDRDLEGAASRGNDELGQTGERVCERVADVMDLHFTHAAYDLADKLVEVLRSLERTDPSDTDEIASDLREQLSGDGATLRGAVRALARTARRYRTAMALRVVIEAYGHILQSHLSGRTLAEQAAEEAELRAIVFGGER